MMDLAANIRQTYKSRLDRLAQSANALKGARGSQKRQLEQQFKHGLDALLESVRDDFPSRLSWNFALNVLYEEANLNNPDLANALRAVWQQRAIQDQKLKNEVQGWHINGLIREMASPKPDLNLLPLGSWFLQFDFKLAKPYISRDDEPFYIIDNPVSRDHVFGLPMIRPSSWKGNLYSALWQLGYEKQNDETMQRLFGDVRSEESGRAGRLFFYPTFFTETGLEIINPHDRKRRVGINPILFECVPAGASGTFSLLYVPFDLVGEPEEKIRQQAAEDVQRVAEGLKAMFLTYGFSAKRSSGYGVAKSSLKDGRLLLNVEDAASTPQTSQPDQEQGLAGYLAAPGKLKDEYLNPDGTFRERSPQELNAMKKKDRQQYDKAKKWWEREGKAPQTAAAPVPEEPPARPPRIEREFTSFDELLNVANALAVQLLQEVKDVAF